MQRFTCKDGQVVQDIYCKDDNNDGDCLGQCFKGNGFAECDRLNDAGAPLTQAAIAAVAAAVLSALSLY